MSYRTIASVVAAALIGIACVSTDALARGGRGGGVHHAGGVHRAGGVHHAGAYHGGAYARRGVGAAAVGAAAVGGAIYNRAQCGYYPYPPCL
jgi:hypothetical protein